MQGHRAPHPQLCRPHLVHPNILIHLDKLEVIQNKGLRIATGCHQKAAATHIRAKTGVLPLRAHLELCCQQFYASALQPIHPSHLIVTSPPPTPAPSELPSKPHTTTSSEACESEVTTLTPPPPLIFGGVLEEGAYPLARSLLRDRMIEETIRSQAPRKVLMHHHPPLKLTHRATAIMVIP